MHTPALAQDLTETEGALWQAYALHIGVADEDILKRMPDMALGEPYVLYGVGMGPSVAEAQAMALDLCGLETCVAMGRPSQKCQLLLAGVTLPFEPVLAQSDTFWGLLESAYHQRMIPVVKPIQVCPFMG